MFIPGDDVVFSAIGWGEGGGEGELCLWAEVVRL